MTPSVLHSEPQTRFFGLDALRGFAILLMVLSGVIPRGVLPDWMYHAQLPPPEHMFNPNLAGFTWVDRVFPLFLFAMGAAFPLALKRYVSTPVLGLKRLSMRYFLLVSFAILLQHVRQGSMDFSLSDLAFGFSVMGFWGLMMMYTKWPESLHPNILNTIGRFGMVLFVLLYPHPKTGGFDLYRSDIILLVLANMAFIGGLIWIFTHKNPNFRWLILVFFAAFYLSSSTESWTQTVWNYSPFQWLFTWDYLKYLFIVIPGMFAGEWLVRAKSEVQHKTISQPLILFGVLFLLLEVILIVGLQAGISAVLLLIVLVLFGAVKLKNKNLIEYSLAITSLIQLSFTLLVLGLLLEPFEGGIKKDPSTFSYYFITSGMSGLLLSVFFVLFDGVKLNGFSWLIGNGQNPMIAYVAFANVLWPILALTGMETIIINWTSTPLTGFLRGVVYTALVAVFTHQFTRKKLFWKT